CFHRVRWRTKLPAYYWHALFCSLLISGSLFDHGLGRHNRAGSDGAVRADDGDAPLFLVVNVLGACADMRALADHGIFGDDGVLNDSAFLHAAAGHDDGI